ncbi:MAG: hypothetical protein N2B05_07335 [Gemmatimonadales bacterium]
MVAVKTHGALPPPALAVLLVFILSLSACGGGSDPVPELFGTWEWVGTSGGITGDSRTPRPDDPAVTVRFDPGGTAVFSRDGEVAREQRYRLSSEVTIFGPEELPVLYFDDEDLGRVVRIEDSATTLTLSDNVYDGFSLQYGRVTE